MTRCGHPRRIETRRVSRSLSGRPAAAAPIGIVLGLGSAAFYSGYILYGSHLLPGLPPVSATATIMTAAAVVWTAYAAVNGQLGVGWTVPRFALIVSFGSFGTTIPVL